MPNKRRCRHCKEYFSPELGLVINSTFYCSRDHVVEYSIGQISQMNKKRQAERKKQTRARKKELEPRTKKYAKLQRLVNQYIVHVRDKGKPCYTCGKTNPSIKYDAGHRYHAGRGGGDRRRFMLENIHKQCSVNCNQHGGGMPVEYDKALAQEYGQDFVAWLGSESNHLTLKDQFPTPQDIDTEIARYRNLLREHDVKPAI